MSKKDKETKINNDVKEKNKNIHDEAKENIKTAFFLNLVFSILEIIGSFLTNSISLFSDSIHDLGDSLSIGASYLLEKKSKKNPDNTYTYGYLRYSLIGALLTSVLLIIGSVVVIYTAIPRIITPEKVNHDAMIIFAIFGVMINGYAAYKTAKGKKLNEKAINLHMLEDVFGWTAVLIGSIVIKTTGCLIIDPILSLLIAIYILLHVYKNLKAVFDVFMEKVPKNIKLDEIKKRILKDIPSIKDIHHIHVWSIDGVSNCMTTHVSLNKNLKENEIIDIKNDIRNILKEFDIRHVTIEIEYNNEVCNNPEC